MIDKIKELMKKANEIGIYVPLIRDPGKGPSVSLTLLFISFNFCILAMVGKWSKMFEGIDAGQAMTLFSACAALYFGRKLTSKGEVVGEEKPKE